MTLQKINASTVKEGGYPGHVTHLQEVAQRICKEALCQTYAEIAPVQQSLDLEQLLQNRDFFRSFKYYLSKGVAETFGANDKRVQVIYLFEPAGQPDADMGQHQPPETTLHLLVVVSKTSAALDAFTEALDRCLARHLNELPLPLPAKRRSILNVLLVTEEAVEQRQGYASLISSILAPPFKIWEHTLNSQNS
jgi:hypothetical protein